MTDWKRTTSNKKLIWNELLQVFHWIVGLKQSVERLGNSGKKWVVLVHGRFRAALPASSIRVDTGGGRGYETDSRIGIHVHHTGHHEQQGQTKQAEPTNGQCSVQNGIIRVGIQTWRVCYKEKKVFQQLYLVASRYNIDSQKSWLSRWIWKKGEMVTVTVRVCARVLASKLARWRCITYGHMVRRGRGGGCVLTMNNTHHCQHCPQANSPGHDRGFEGTNTANNCDSPQPECCIHGRWHWSAVWAMRASFGHLYVLAIADAVYALNPVGGGGHGSVVTDELPIQLCNPHEPDHRQFPYRPHWPDSIKKELFNLT